VITRTRPLNMSSDVVEVLGTNIFLRQAMRLPYKVFPLIADR